MLNNLALFAVPVQVRGEPGERRPVRDDIRDLLRLPAGRQHRRQAGQAARRLAAGGGRRLGPAFAKISNFY